MNYHADIQNQFFYEDHNLDSRADALARAIFWAAVNVESPGVIYHTLSNSFVVQKSPEPVRGVQVLACEDLAVGGSNAYNNGCWLWLSRMVAKTLHRVSLGDLADELDKLRSVPPEKLALQTLEKNLITEFTKWQKSEYEHVWAMTYEPACKFFISYSPSDYSCEGFITSDHFYNVYLPKHPEAYETKPKALAREYVRYLTCDCREWWRVNMAIRTHSDIPLSKFIRSAAELKSWKEVADKRQQTPSW